MIKLSNLFLVIIQLFFILKYFNVDVEAASQKENMKTVSDVFKAYGEGNIDKVMSYFAPGMIVNTVASAQTNPTFKTYKGNYLEYLYNYGSTFSIKSFSVASMTSSENQVAVILDADIAGPNTGKSTGPTKQTILFSFDKKGKITEELVFLDTAASNDILTQGQTQYSNLAFITKNIEHYNSKNVDLALGDYDPNAVIKSGLDPASDLAAAKEAFKSFIESFPDCNFEILNLVGDGNSVAQNLVISGTFSGKPLAGMEPTNKKFKTHEIVISTIKNGKIIAEHAAINLADIFAQISPDS